MQEYKDHIQDLAAMREYKEYIQDLATNDVDQVFFNSSAAHASLVMETIFNKSTNVNLFAGSLSGQVSGRDNYKKALYNFFERDGKLRIMLQAPKFDLLKPRPSIFKLLFFFNIIKPGSVEVRKGNFSVIEGDTGDEFHFMTGDSIRYRLENNIETFSASGNFKDQTTALKLDAMFEQIFEKGEPINLMDIG